MKTLGLIVEYNPFHNGHLYHLNKSKEITNATHTVAIMSGHFLQRGEPSLFDKYTRAQMAVSNGVDLVIELPTLFSSQSAEIFSFGAISTLNSTNAIDCVCFGSEVGNIDILYKIGELLVNEPLEFKVILKNYLSEGMLFPKARSKALFQYINKYNVINISEDEIFNILNSPNNILGIEYIKSILKLNSNIKPYTITRVKSDYNSKEINSDICSATAIRESLKSNSNIYNIENVVPNNTYKAINDKIVNNFYPIYDEDFYNILSGIILRDENILDSYFEVNEGIENKIIGSLFKSTSLYDLQMNVKSKRYTLTKIKRTLNNIMLGIKKDEMSIIKSINNIPYIRVLAFNTKGREILKKIKTNSDITIINKLAKADTSTNEITNLMLTYDIKATNLYNLIYYRNNKTLLKGPMDYYISPKYIRE